jgi:hypothetical protein
MILLEMATLLWRILDANSLYDLWQTNDKVIWSEILPSYSQLYLEQL